MVKKRVRDDMSLSEILDPSENIHDVDRVGSIAERLIAMMNRLGLAEFDELRPVEETCVRVWVADGEIGCDGFELFYENNGLEYMRCAAEAMVVLGCNDSAAVISKAVVLLESSLNDGDDIESLSDDELVSLEALKQEYFNQIGTVTYFEL